MAITFTWNNPNSELYLPEEVVIYRDTNPFDAEDLPEVYETISNLSTSYTDDDAEDGIRYYYRIGYRLGIKEEVSRLIEILAPTEPDLFTVRSSRRFMNNYNEETVGDYGAQFAIYKSFDDVYPLHVNPSHYQSTYYLGAASDLHIIYRLAAMAAIQRFRRTVWLTEGFTISDMTAEFTVYSNTGELGYHAGVASGIPVGSTMTWKEAFDFIAKTTACVDIILHVFNELHTNICQTLTRLRGVNPADVNKSFAMMCWNQHIMALGGGGISGRGLPRGVSIPRPGSVAPISPTTENYSYCDPEAVVRCIGAIFREWPEIEAACAVNDQRQPITYTDDLSNVVDWLGQSTNSYVKADPLQSMFKNNSNAHPGNVYSPRRSSLNGLLNTVSGHVALTGMAPLTGAANNDSHAYFYKCPTLNGKDFILFDRNTTHCSRITAALGMMWSGASATDPEYTDGLSTVDPLEDYVALRWIPSLGLVDQSAYDTTLTCLNSELLANHLSSQMSCEGFPDDHFALRGSASTSFGTILTNLNLIALARAGTSFTVEMFCADMRLTTNPSNTASSSLISLGNIASGQRYAHVNQLPYYYGAFALMAGGVSSTPAISPYSAAQIWSQQTADRDARGYAANYHIALQYDAIAAELKLFVNGTIQGRYVGVPAVTAVSYLAFLGMQNNATDLTTSRQYSANALAYGDIAIHEIVVTLAKRYNYDHFVGQVPFARKRFAA